VNVARNDWSRKERERERENGLGKKNVRQSVRDTVTNKRNGNEKQRMIVPPTRHPSPSSDQGRAALVWLKTEKREKK